MELEHAFDYVFPIFLGSALEDAQFFTLEKDGFLGSGFFIAKNGVAITAAHVLPMPEAIPGKQVRIGQRTADNRIQGYVIESFVIFQKFDIAIMKVDIGDCKYLPIVFRDLWMGMDVATIGIPASSIIGNGFGMRCFKGHISWAGERPELSFPAPKGLSGSPVFHNGKVVGVISGNSRSEQLDDSVETIEEITNNYEKIRIVESKSIVQYGVMESLKKIEHCTHEIFGASTFAEMIEAINQTT